MLTKLTTATIATIVAISLSGCSGITSDSLISNASYEAGVLVGKSATQEALDMWSDGTIDTFCEALAQEALKVPTIEDFSSEEFTKGCVEGYKDANQ
jgi:hypothetical protein